MFIYREYISEKKAKLYKEIVLSSYKSQTIKMFWVCTILICNKDSSLMLDIQNKYTHFKNIHQNYCVLTKTHLLLAKK